MGVPRPQLKVVSLTDAAAVRIKDIMAKAEHGLALAPNQSATKVAWLLDNVAGARDRDLCCGTVDTWLAWTLSAGELHVSDHTNAAVTGLTSDSAWRARTKSVIVAHGMRP